jgi:hypothetical protein
VKITNVWNEFMSSLLFSTHIFSPPILLFPSSQSPLSSFFTFLLSHHPVFSSLFSYCGRFASRLLSSPLLLLSFLFFPSFYWRLFSSNLFSFHFCRNTSVGIATGYGLDGPGSIPGKDKIFSAPQCPDRLRGPPSLLYNGYRWLFPQE